MTQIPQTKRSFLGSLLALPIATAVTAPARAQTERKESDRELLERLAAAQRETEARQQITEILYRYARGWDRRDGEAILSCFFPDSTTRHGGFNGLSTDFVDVALKATEHVKAMNHMITNVSIEFAGDRAVSECYFLAHHRRPVKDSPDQEQDWFLKGRYLDKFERRDGVWKIVHRRGLHDYSRTFIPADTSLDAAAADQLSQRKPDDPLYSMLAELGAGD